MRKPGAQPGNQHGFHKGMISWNKGKKVRLNPKGEFRKGIKPWNTGSRKQRVKCKCKVCGKVFEEFASGIAEGRGKYCSRACWLKIVWKGENVKYQALHQWVRRNLGEPEECSFCHKKEKDMQWANKSHEYKRNLTDWIRLCRSCHKKYDLKFLRR